MTMLYLLEVANTISIMMLRRLKKIKRHLRSNAIPTKNKKHHSDQDVILC